MFQSPPTSSPSKNLHHFKGKLSWFTNPWINHWPLVVNSPPKAFGKSLLPRHLASLSSLSSPHPGAEHRIGRVEHISQNICWGNRAARWSLWIFVMFCSHLSLMFEQTYNWYRFKGSFRFEIVKWGPTTKTNSRVTRGLRGSWDLFGSGVSDCVTCVLKTQEDPAILDDVCNVCNY